MGKFAKEFTELKYFDSDAIDFLIAQYNIPREAFIECLLEAEFRYEDARIFDINIKVDHNKNIKIHREKYKKLSKHLKNFMSEWEELSFNKTDENLALKLMQHDRSFLFLKENGRLDFQKTIKTIDAHLRSLDAVLEKGAKAKLKRGTPSKSRTNIEEESSSTLEGLYAFAKVVGELWENKLGHNFGQHVDIDEDRSDDTREFNEASVFLFHCAEYLEGHYTQENCITVIKRVKKGTGRGQYLNSGKKQKN